MDVIWKALDHKTGFSHLGEKNLQLLDDETIRSIRLVSKSGRFMVDFHTDFWEGKDLLIYVLSLLHCSPYILHIATFEDKPQIVKIILENRLWTGLDLSIVDSLGNNAFLAACHYGRSDSAKVFLSLLDKKSWKHSKVHHPDFLLCNWLLTV